MLHSARTIDSLTQHVGLTASKAYTVVIYGDIAGWQILSRSVVFRGASAAVSFLHPIEGVVLPVLDLDPVLRPPVVAPIGTQTKDRPKAVRLSRLLGCDQARRSVARKATPQQGYNLRQNGRPLILAQQNRLIERKAPSQQAQQKDRFAKACPNARYVKGDDQHVHKATWPPLAVRVKNNEGLSVHL